MSDMNPAQAPKQTASEIFAQLTKDREAGRLAERREYSTEPLEKPKVEVPGDFKELSDDELLKLTKAEMLDYMKNLTAYNAALARAEAQADAEAAARAAIHGIPRQPDGELLETGYRRGIPTPLKDKDGEPRLNKAGKPVTRTDY